MPARALIIAIEEYPKFEGPDKTLPGTKKDGQTFRNWLKGCRSFANMQPQDEPKRILICSDDATVAGRTHGASAQEIRKALGDLWTFGHGSTEELYVYFSGHGFLFKEGEASRAADVLIASDFGAMNVSGAMCFRLDALQNELLSSMGPGNHYYFIDACRNPISDADLAVGPLGVRLQRSPQRDARKFTMFSTDRLATAATESKFADHLVEGLKGFGRAKYAFTGPPPPPRLRVAWTTLLTYMKSMIPGVDGPADGIAVLWDEPLRTKTCRITIENAAADDTFNLMPKDSLERTLTPFAIHGATAEWKQPPDDYYLSIDHPNSVVSPKNAPVNLYEDSDAHFVMQLGGLEAVAVAEAPAVAIPTLTVIGPAGSTIKLHNAQTEEVTTAQQTLKMNVKPGSPCLVEVFDREGTLIARRNVTAALDENPVLDLRYPQSPLRLALSATFPSSPDGGWIDFSESLEGPVTDPDLALWLSIIAASRVLGPDRFEKLVRMPLQTFDDVQPGSSAFYVLAAFDDIHESFRVGTGTSAANHTWLQRFPVVGFPGLFELKMLAQPGGLLVSFGLGNRAPYTIASYALPNRATAIAVTWREGQFRIHQLLLPIRGLEQHLDPTVRERLPDKPLRLVKFVAQAQRLLARRRSIAESVRLGPEWYESLYGKWLDPMMGIVACYELIRQGNSPDLKAAVANLTSYFGEMPDTAALRKMMAPADPIAPPSWPPLVSDGLAAFPDATIQPLPASKADYSGLWTSWRNAVNPWFRT